MTNKERKRLIDRISTGIYELEFYRSVYWSDQRELDCKEEGLLADGVADLVELDLIGVIAPLVEEGIVRDDGGTFVYRDLHVQLVSLRHDLEYVMVNSEITRGALGRCALHSPLSPH